MGFYDLIFDHDTAKSIVDQHGWDAYLQHMENIFKCNFNSCSMDWYDNPRYICKLRGSDGDRIIGWETHITKKVIENEKRS